MPASQRREYRGYRIEASQPDTGGWRLAIFRLHAALPAPMRYSDIRYPSANVALMAGRKDVDWLLDRQR